jgi:hypothetical protein
MIYDFFSLINDAELGRPIACLVQRILISAIHSHLPEHNSRKLLELPSHSTPIDGPHDRGEVWVTRIFVKQLPENFLRAFQTFPRTALPMNHRIGVIQSLNPTPGEHANLDRLARHDSSRHPAQGIQRIHQK